MEKKITSTIEMYDIETKTRSIVKEFDFHLEAPNWTPDGKSLLYNSGGLLYLFDLESKEAKQVDTGSCTRCNNDHVISADSKWIYISNGGMDSKVYCLPYGGGEPRLITENEPSFLHGITPDGKTLAYCAARNGEFDVYTISVEGGQEKQLTTAPGLNDGPEYSPDGQYIWFNSVRTGLMQAWRMKADGSEQTQMTFHEDLNSWFPHISPDGKNVVYIAYNKGDVKPGDHPPEKNVQLRLMPAEGGQSEKLADLFGGQGSINVNSWAPDSKRFVFVSYKIG